MIPGEVRVAGQPAELETGPASDTLVIVNDGDRPVQVGSHLHLPAANPALKFDRARAAGCRLDIPSGTSVRFEPGVSRTVDIVELGGRKYVPGLQIHAGDDLPTHGREPRPVVPFGAPGSEVAQAPRAAGKRVRVSEHPAEPGADDEGSQA